MLCFSAEIYVGIFFGKSFLVFELDVIIMKKLQVAINLDMDIPDEWTLLEHPDGVPVLALGDGRYMYMSFLPMFTQELVPESAWTSDCSEDFSEQVIAMVQGEEVEMKVVNN